MPSVGHCHPRVTEAIARQAATLNTHTRYASELILDYAERLLGTYPAELGNVMFTCTGSEAVDLALRIARFLTGGEGTIITANAYHGVTTAAAEISPSLGPAVPLGRAVWTVAPPAAQESENSLAERVRNSIADMNRHGVRLAAFIADSLFSSDGIRPDPAGVLKPVVDAVHEAGGLYIADEVQPGFGRTGEAMWGFQRHGIVPDLAVMGKPMGNGMPIAGVAARPEILEEFGHKIRYFNTFGGNSVSIAAAAAVLDVIETEGLRENARVVGRYLRDTLTDIAGRRLPHRRRARRRPVRRGRLRRARHRRARRRRRDPRGQRPAGAARADQRDRPARQHAEDPPAAPVRPAPRRPARRSPLRHPPRPRPRPLTAAQRLRSKRARTVAPEAASPASLSRCPALGRGSASSLTSR